jgi:CRISPR-associated protein Cas5d
MSEQSRLLKLRARGDIACFTRPEMKVERVSYEVMTPGAARGLFESIVWKPAICWQIHEIAVLAPIRWMSFRRNEIMGRASPKGGPLFIEESHVQRNTVALRDVDYVITASFEMTKQAGPEDNLFKFEEMFLRRMEKGQHFAQPYLGCREFAAEVSPAHEKFEPIDAAVDRPLGMMFYDFDYQKKGGTRPLFFEARLTNGVLQVPSWNQVLQENEVK